MCILWAALTELPRESVSVARPATDVTGALPTFCRRAEGRRLARNLSWSSERIGVTGCISISPVSSAHSPHWPLLFRAPADPLSQRRLNLNSFLSFPKPSLNRPSRSFFFCECIRNTLPPADSSPFSSLKKVELWTSRWTGTFFFFLWEAVLSSCCSKCTELEQCDAIFSPTVETPAWEEEVATGLPELLF